MWMYVGLFGSIHKLHSLVRRDGEGEGEKMAARGEGGKTLDYVVGHFPFNLARGGCSLLQLGGGGNQAMWFVMMVPLKFLCYIFLGR